MSGPENPPSTEYRNGPAPGGLLIGYARVSTDDQKLDLQHDALAAAGVARERIYEEYISGARANRPQLDQCLKALRPGDVLVVWRLDRLGRKLRELAQITEELERRGVGFRSLNENFDTTTAGGRFIFHVMGAMAEFERNLISERTKAGLKAARLRGHRGGRPMKISRQKWRMIKAWIDDNPTDTYDAIAKEFGVSRSALYRAKQKYEDQDEIERMRVHDGHNPRPPAD